MRIGDANRVVGSTGMNDVSSRSHSVLQIGLEVRDTATRSATVGPPALKLAPVLGKLVFVNTGSPAALSDESRRVATMFTAPARTNLVAESLANHTV